MLNYTDLANRVMRDVVRKVRDLRHIDPDRIVIVANARCTGQFTGNLANCCALRGEARPTFSIWTRSGSRQIVAVSQWFQAFSPRVRVNGRSMLYMIQLRLPRVLLTNPLETLVHELYHIGEKFDGRMRPVRHGPFFDREVRRMMREWLAVARGDLPQLAQMKFGQLVREHGAIVALGLPPSFKVPYLEAVSSPETYRQGVARLYPNHRLAPDYQVRRIKLSNGESLRLLTERDLVLRHYDRRGARRLPAIYSRYARSSVEALSA